MDQVRTTRHLIILMIVALITTILTGTALYFEDEEQMANLRGDTVTKEAIGVSSIDKKVKQVAIEAVDMVYTKRTPEVKEYSSELLGRLKELDNTRVYIADVLPSAEDTAEKKEAGIDGNALDGYSDQEIEDIRAVGSLEEYNRINGYTDDGIENEITQENKELDTETEIDMQGREYVLYNDLKFEGETGVIVKNGVSWVVQKDKYPKTWEMLKGSGHLYEYSSMTQEGNIYNVMFICREHGEQETVKVTTDGKSISNVSLSWL